MRVAVISDIHGNAHALEAVLADIVEMAPDTVLNLGDHFSGPFEAGRTADMLIDRDFPSIAGNHDRWLIDPPDGKLKLLEEWALPQLSQRHLDWVRALPKTRVIADEIFMCHATPQDDMTQWLDRFNGEGVVAQQPQALIEEIGAGYDFPVILCGHTHVPRVASLSGGRIVVNPGSIGCPGYAIPTEPPIVWSAGSPHARYAVLDKGAHGWNVNLRAVSYDFEAAAKLAATTGSHDIAKAVATGWVK